MKTILDIMRVRNCSIAAVGVIVGAVLAVSGNPELVFSSKVWIAAFAAFLITGGGNTLNDYFDLEIDKVNKPHRPIPSGRIPKSDAIMLAATLFLIGLGLSKHVNQLTLYIAIVNTIVLTIYAVYSKRLLGVANFGISYLVASVFIYGAASTVTGDTQLVLGKLTTNMILTVCAFFMTFSREIIKDVEDLEGDKRAYSKTLPIVHGVKPSRNIALLFTVMAVLFSFMPFIVSIPGFNLMGYAILIIIADLIFLVSYTMHEAIAQQLHILGMILALLAFFAGAIG